MQIDSTCISSIYSNISEVYNLTYNNWIFFELYKFSMEKPKNKLAGLDKTKSFK